MSKITNIIFNGKKHYITSPYGKRKSFTTKGGATSYFHYGTDYGTNGVKLPQYAIEHGYCFASARASDGANFVWIVYPRIKKAFLYYHLDKRAIKAGEKVKMGTLLGYTGSTGKSTGVHLHLGVRDLSGLSTSRINNMTYSSLKNCPYIDPEKYALKWSAPVANAKTSGNPYTRPKYPLNYEKYHYPAIKRGDEGVKWLQYELQKIGFYTSTIEGFYGEKTENAVKSFQKSAGLEPDGKAYTKTFDALEKSKKS